MATMKEHTEEKKRGRPRNNDYLSFEEARETVRAEMIPSRGKYFEWWERNKPKTIPRFPYRVYDKEWVSWNDFLGTDNKFNEKIGTRWRPFLEAVAWAHKQSVGTQAEWFEFCKLEGKLPEDIPARPDLVYKEWRSWGHWLGNKLSEAVTAKQTQRTQVFYIIRYHGAPGNVMSFGVEPGGQSALRDRWESEKFDVVKLFWYDPSKAQEIQRIIDALSTPYQGYDRERIVPNVWEIIWYLQMHLELITKLSA